MADLFISHASADDAFVRRLRQRLQEHGVDAWIDSRELLPGGLLEPGITQAIESSSAFAVVVSPNALQSRWVGQELRRSLEVQRQRGRDAYAVIPLCLDGAKLGALESLFDAEPFYVPVSSAAGGVDAAIHSLLVALGRRLPTDVEPPLVRAQQPLEELRLELSGFEMENVDGSSRASARARIVYETGTPGQPPTSTSDSWHLVAPLGETEIGDLQWYLGAFARWPSEHFRIRAEAVEANLVRWGNALHDAAFPAGAIADVVSAWSRLDVADRRFSVFVDPGIARKSGAGAPAPGAQEIAAHFLALPWELLHDGQKHFVEGARAVCIRRRVPTVRPHEAAVVSPPIRVLVVSPRPEDDVCEYADPRASTLPLVDAFELLGEIVQLRVLSPPTLPALREELDRARSAGEPYHVVHVDAFAVADENGIAGLCFEDPQDLGRLSKRRCTRVTAPELGMLLRDQGVSVVFVDARWSTQGYFVLESIAAMLLGVGVGSVVTTREPALPEATRRFATGFYRTLANGGRVGAAVLEGQRQLKDDDFRGKVRGAGDARIHDWFNPVLYQSGDDLQLFHFVPGRQTEADIRAALRTRFGALPEAPRLGFVGRSRELLALERLLQQASYAVIRGSVGSGKTALAAEFARWSVRTRRVECAAFVALDAQTTPKEFLNAVATQLLGHDAVRGGTDDLDACFKLVERALVERGTLIVIDDVQRTLTSPGDLGRPGAVPRQESGFAALAAVCQRLLAIDPTRILFASRERVPAPFEGLFNRLELMPLTHDDGVELVERHLSEWAVSVGRAEVDELVDVLYGHAGTLAALGVPLLRSGIAGARGGLGGFLRELERRHPGDDHLSPLAGIEHALVRMSAASQTRARVLAPFQGGVETGLIVDMTGWSVDDVRQLVWELIESGLATPLNESYLALVPGLSSYLRGQASSQEWEDLEKNWQQAVRSYGAFLATTGRQDAESSKRFALDIPNFLALLDYDERVGDATTTLGTATSLIRELSALGKPALVDRVTGILRTTLEQLKGDWSQAHFAGYSSRVDALLGEGRITNACEAARSLVQIAKAAGGDAYEDADYDIAMACYLLGRALGAAERYEEALPLLDEAQSRFESVQRDDARLAAARMAVACATQRADCLASVYRLDEAAAIYEHSIGKWSELKDERNCAVAISQLGTVRRRQGRFDEALAAFATARRTFSGIDEPAWIANGYGESGVVYVALGRFQDAEVAYREALQIWVRIGDESGEAKQLENLATLYADHLNRVTEAVELYRRAADVFARLGDVAGEAYTRNNLAATLSQLGRFDEGRAEIERSLECKKPFGHSLQPWTSWDILATIERGAGDAAAAMKAQQAALDSYLLFRREGGVIDGPGKLTGEVERRVQADGPAAALAFLKDLRGEPSSGPELQAFCDVLGAIVAGNLDPTAIVAAGLNYAAAAEALLMIEHLEALARR